MIYLNTLYAVKYEIKDDVANLNILMIVNVQSPDLTY